MYVRVRMHNLNRAFDYSAQDENRVFLFLKMHGIICYIGTPFTVTNEPCKFDRSKEGVNGVNRLATKGEKILLTTDKTRKKLPTSDKIIN